MLIVTMPKINLIFVFSEEDDTFLSEIGDNVLKLLVSSSVSRNVRSRNHTIMRERVREGELQ